MLNDFNPLVQNFSMDQQRLFSPDTAKVAIRLDGLDGILYNLLYAHCYVHTFNIIYATYVQPINIVFCFLIFRMHFASRKSSGLGRPFDGYMQLILEPFVIKMVGLWFSVYLGSLL
jgi:hypothetical protein